MHPFGAAARNRFTLIHPADTGPGQELYTAFSQSRNEKTLIMPRRSHLLALARQRAEAFNLPYAGALTPAEAAEILKLTSGAHLVDVRTRAELDWVGRIPQAIEIEWSHYPGMVLNPNFIAQLKQQVDRESLLLLICRNGERSDQAARAAAGAGFSSCYNVLEGFEGDRDANGQRSRIGGWRHAGLPWTQS